MKSTTQNQEAASTITQHMEKMFPDTSYRNAVMDWMAFSVQNPDKKIRWALLIQGVEGCGKTFFFQLLKAILGPEKAVLLGQLDVKNKWNSWAESHKVVGIEEVVVPGADSYQILNNIKTIITNDEITIDVKGKPNKVVKNLANVITFSCFLRSIPLVQGDRRYLAIKSSMQSKQDVLALGSGYFDNLFGILHHQPDIVAQIFKEHVISSNFNPDKAPSF